eukprot:gene48831-56675_t
MPTQPRDADYGGAPHSGPARDKGSSVLIPRWPFGCVDGPVV